MITFKLSTPLCSLSPIKFKVGYKVHEDTFAAFWLLPGLCGAHVLC